MSGGQRPTERQPRASVVAATRNRPLRLVELVDSLRGQTVPGDDFELIIVDDASDDPRAIEALGQLEASGDLSLRVIRRSRAEGPAAARNDGWRAARAPLVAFTDDDCIAAPGWLAALLAAARSQHCIVQGSTLPRPDELDRLGPFSRTQRVEALGPFFQTCNMAYSQALLEQLDGFDAAAFPVPGGEDTDLAWRALEAGAQPVWAPEARVFHAVERLGPFGLLRVAWRWTHAMHVYPQHPGLRRQVFTHRIFWKPEHYLLARALLALAVPGRRRVLRRWLAWPYFNLLLWRSLQPHARGPLLIPYLALHDAVELAAVTRAALRHRMLIL